MRLCDGMGDKVVGGRSICRGVGWKGFNHDGGGVVVSWNWFLMCC